MASLKSGASFARPHFDRIADTPQAAQSTIRNLARSAIFGNPRPRRWCPSWCQSQMRTWNMGRGRQRSRFESASRSAHGNRWTAPCRVLAFLSTIWAWTFRNHWKAMWRLPSRATMLFGSAFCIRSLTAPPTMSWLPRRARERDRPGTSRDSSIRGAKVFAVCAALQVCAGIRPDFSSQQRHFTDTSHRSEAASQPGTWCLWSCWWSLPEARLCNRCGWSLPEARSWKIQW